MLESLNTYYTYFIKLTPRRSHYPYTQDWVECVVIHDLGDNYITIMPCDDNFDCVTMNLVYFNNLIEDGRVIENYGFRYHIETYDCYEPVGKNAYLHHSAHYITAK